LYDPRRTSVRTYLFGVVRNQSLKRLQRSDSPGEDGQRAGPGRSPEDEAMLGTGGCGRPRRDAAA
jgi:hypothetical protein